MKPSSEEIKAQLLQSDENFRKLYEQHRQYDQKLQEFSQLKYPTPQEQIEIQNLKKLKLKLKDQMEQIIRQRMLQSS